MPSSGNQHLPPAWGQPLYQELEVPSGGTCLVRKIQPLDLIGDEILGATDMLGGIVMDKIKAAQTPSGGINPLSLDSAAEQERMDEIFKAMSKPENLPTMIDRVVSMSVVEPKLVMPPTLYADRVDGIVYIDTVPFGDKMFIFDNAMGSMNSLRPFRESTDPTLGNLESVAIVPSVAESDPPL